MNYFYNPLAVDCKSHTGAIPRGTDVTFHINEEGGEDGFSAGSCTFIYWRDEVQPLEIPMQRTKDGFTVTLNFSCTGLYFYRFRIDGRLFGCGAMRKGEFLNDEQDAPSWQITVFEEDYETPAWMKGGVMYQIFPDRFFKSGEYPISDRKLLREDWGGIPEYKPDEYGKVLNRDFFGGNLNGIREKLDYLKSLNITVIYLNPIFEAFSNHRYDTGDYMKIDSLLGTVEDFDRLIHEAGKKGIKIILDGVFNHTGADSRYFNKFGNYKDEPGAYQSPESPYFNWYNFFSYPNGYDCWWGIETLPAVNEYSKSYQEFIFGKNGVLKTWLRHGIGGYRLDVADEMPDFFLEKLRNAVKEENAGAVIIGEVWEDASNKISYSKRRKYLLGKELDSVMNYPLKDAIIDFAQTGITLRLRETLAMLQDNYPKQTLDCLMNILGTHDTVRILTALGGPHLSDQDEMAQAHLTDEQRRLGLERLKIAALLQYTLPGVPCTFYGDETGMEGYRDPFCRRCFDWDNVNENLLAYYRKLGEIRTQKFSDVFCEGTYREIFAGRNYLIFERKGEKRSVYVFVNQSSEKMTVRFDGAFREYLSGQSFTSAYEITPYSYGVLSKIQ